MLPIAVAVKCTSRGPVFYRALRGGYHNRPFSILKFPHDGGGRGPVRFHHGAGRSPVTRVGRVLRHSKLDELPQLFNILKGTCPSSGPGRSFCATPCAIRPSSSASCGYAPASATPAPIHLINLDELVGHDDPEGCYEAKILDEKNRMRVAYARSQSFGLDAKVFLGYAFVRTEEEPQEGTVRAARNARAARR